MEIFAFNSRYIADLISKFHNKEIEEKKFNKKILVGLTFNYYFFKKEKKKYKKIKESQNKIFQSHFRREATQEITEKKLLSKIRNKDNKEQIEDLIKEQRKNLMEFLFQQKDVDIYTEHTYNSYIPPKNIALSFEFYIKFNKENKEFISQSSQEINYHNWVINQEKKINTIDDYIESPYIINNEYKNNKSTNEKYEAKNNEISEYIKKNSEIKKILESEDNIIFPEEKLSENEDLNQTNNWLKETEMTEIDKNFGRLSETQEENNKVFFSDNDSFLKANQTFFNNSTMDSHPLFSEDNINGDQYIKFSTYMSEKCFRMYMKKMNFTYLNLMLLSYFDLENEINIYYPLETEQIVINFIKKIVLFCGISSLKIYDHIIKNILSKKGSFNLENYLDCFAPIFEASDKYQAFKYKFLLYLIKNHFSNTISLQNYKVFCELIRGKWIYCSDTCDDLNNKLIPTFREKYPKDDFINLNYLHLNTIVEYLVDMEYGE